LIWAKTDAGRAEIQARSQVKERAQRNLLLLIDGKTPAETLLANLVGITAADFETLRDLGLIVAIAEPEVPAPVVVPARDILSVDVTGLDYATLRGHLGRMISKELGIRGFTLTMVLEESLTVDDLKGVAERLLKQIADRKGRAAAAAAKKVLVGD